MESTRGLQEGGPLRGGPMERRSRPGRDTERGPSPPGKPGAMGHVRRDRSTPGSGGSALATKGYSAGFGGGKSAKSPNGCGPFAPGRPVRVLHLGLRRKTPAALGESALGRAFTARCRRRAPRGQTQGKRQGINRPREGRVIRRRVRRRRTWMCPYAFVSLQKSMSGSDPEKPFPQTQLLQKSNTGVAVNGG
jgi:hypothetical protein